ncbi:IQ and ubiquitin-like domain-containing protein [Callorhinchus milii]|nr:IQ and ubiquitin-like domain-containing protein [Callorhinchus milii]|eukprot:gi/632961442/ref/XP_007896759.1/ PREDICTED: IQ and ubiquitin-like domain-containing protein [Callorhinchus milii]
MEAVQTVKDEPVPRVVVLDLPGISGCDEIDTLECPESASPPMSCEDLQKILEEQMRQLRESGTVFTVFPGMKSTVEPKKETCVPADKSFHPFTIVRDVSPAGLVLPTPSIICGLDQLPIASTADRDLKLKTVIQSYAGILKDTVVDECVTATVKVVLLPDEHVMTLAFPICSTTGKLKERFGKELKIPPRMLKLTYNSKTVNDSQTLVDLGVRPHGAFQLELSSISPLHFPIKPIRPQQFYTSDIITVRVIRADNTCCEVAVEIERVASFKPFLGGYRHKLTGQEFHHAGTQTSMKKRVDDGVERFCRETQTTFEKNRAQQTANNTSTQMTKIGCYVSSITDKLVCPGVYMTATEFHARRLKAIIVIQTHTRRWLAKSFVQELRVQRDKWLEWSRLEDQLARQKKVDYLKGEYERRMNPKTKEDFDLLYYTLQRWKEEELDYINRTLSGPARKAALCTLLEKEAELISSIGRHKIRAVKESKPLLIEKLLKKCADPIRWRAFDGRITEMDTQFTLRAKELRDIYNTINMRYLTQDERLDALLTLKQTVMEHNCKLTQDIVELIDREADLLLRDVKECNLKGLRKRISTLFLQYIKTPMFNPEIARFLKIPQDPMQLRKRIYYCASCASYLPSTEFVLSITSRSVGACRKCIRLHNEAGKREEYSNYKLMLTELRTMEAAYRDGAQVAFLVKQQDLKYLVENIWGGQSTLSSETNLHDLILVRWDQKKEWSPWNCMLLTKEEAKAHFLLNDIEKDYEPPFIRKMKHRHTLAKKYYARIPQIRSYAENCLMQDLTPQENVVSRPSSSMPTT